MNLFKKLWSKKEEETLLKQLAAEEMQIGRDKAEAVLKVQEDGMKDLLIKKDGYVEMLINDGEYDRFILGLKLSFLWGVFHEHVQNYDMPTNGYDRIILHLVDWLMRSEGFDNLEDAVTEARSIDDKYNEADEAFDKIFNYGKKAYYGDTTHFFAQFLTLIDQQPTSD